MSVSDPNSNPQQGLALPGGADRHRALSVPPRCFWQTPTMPVSPMYSKVGPTVFPYMTAAGLAVLAVLLLVQAMRGGWQPEDEER